MAFAAQIPPATLSTSIQLDSSLDQQGLHSGDAPSSEAVHADWSVADLANVVINVIGSGSSTDAIVSPAHENLKDRKD